MAYRYRTVKINGKTKLLHRHLVEQRIGRPLEPGEHVHHDNEQRFDNSDDNLIVKDALQHIREHAEARRIHPREKLCEVCGARFTPHATKRKRKKTCSKPCADTLRSRTERATKAAIVMAQFGIRRAEAVA